MTTVAAIDALTEQLYTNPDAAARRAAEQQLCYLTEEILDLPPVQLAPPPTAAASIALELDTTPTMQHNEDQDQQQQQQQQQLEQQRRRRQQNGECITNQPTYTLYGAALQQSNSPYTIVYLSQALVRWFKANSKFFYLDEMEELIVGLCGGCLSRLAVSAAPRHVMLSMLTCYARLTKLTFIKEPYVPATVDFPLSLLQNTAPQEDPQHFLALLLLDTMVNEISKYDSSKATTFMNYATHRRCSNNFRDEAMQKIFMAAVTELERLPSADPNATHNNTNTTNSNSNANTMNGGDPNGPNTTYNSHGFFVTETVDLVRDVLLYDFMAIIVDETEEALASQFPTAWRDMVLSNYTTGVLWGQQRALPYPFCDQLLLGLCSLCGIRRAFFTDAEERVAYLDRTLELMVEAANVPDGRMNIPAYVTTYAEAAARFIAPFGYRDLCQSRHFERWVGCMQAVSQKVFPVRFGDEGSFTTTTAVMVFWSKLASSRRTYVDGQQAQKDLEQVLPNLCLTFFQNHVCGNNNNNNNNNNSNNKDGNSNANGGGAAALAVIEDGEYDVALEAVLAQAEAFASMVMLAPLETFGELARYCQMSLGPSLLENPLATAWLFFIAGNLVRQALPFIDDEHVEACSHFFTYCVDCANHRRTSYLQNMNHSNGATSGDGCGGQASIFVERAVLHFLTNVEAVLTGSRLQEALTTVVTNVFQSRVLLFQFILNNTGSNILRGVTGRNDEETAQVMRLSINLIDEACRDVPTSFLADLHFEIPPVVELPLAQNSCTYKLRSNLYAVLWRLTPHIPYTSDILRQFLVPIERCIQNTLSGSMTEPAYVAGWMRDLRGVSQALIDEPEPFQDFIEWFCDLSETLLRVLSTNLNRSSIVVSSYLHFARELVDSHNGRYPLTSSSSHSALGLLLFKHLCAQLEQIVSVCSSEEQLQLVACGGGGSADGVYDTMLRPIALSMQCVTNCVKDGFVPFGAMWFYRDSTYDDMLLRLLRTLNNFEPHFFREYRQVSSAIVELLRTIADEQTYHPLAALSAADLDKIISFVIYVCEDTETEIGPLLNGMTFLAFVANFVVDVKALSNSNQFNNDNNNNRNNNNNNGGCSTPPPHHTSPMMQPQYYVSPSTGCVSGTPLGGTGPRGGAGRLVDGQAGARSLHRVRETLARTLEPFSDLWLNLIRVAMNIIILQDRGLSVSCSVVYPILEAHPPFWYRYAEELVQQYPTRKQRAVGEALSNLLKAGETQSKFFSEVFSFRQDLRNL